MLFRPARPEDLEVIADFNARLAHESEGVTLDRNLLVPGVRAMLADASKGRYFLAEDAGVVVGQMGVTYEWSDWRNGYFWWVQSVYVRPESRRLGVFRRLYAHVRTLATNDPEVIGVRLYVDEHNTPAQETYRRLRLAKTSYFVMEEYPLANE